MRAPHPLVPFSLLKDRGVWAGFRIAVFVNCSWYLQGDFLFTVLVVAFDSPLQMLPESAAFIAEQIILGVAGGLVPYPAQASVQAVTKHQNMAVFTGLYLASYNVGSALGNCIAGGIWTQTLYGALESNLKNSKLAEKIYGDPFSAVPL
ncbi:hypothetical protein BJ742DRAFT_765854 [Cladochytrium replicatum]|nr:hypothetical protein BJ742DRAFT_765854 [Cladochytrium replicatum]